MMKYRPLGTTGFNISQLAFGAMRLPWKEGGTLDHERSIRMLHRAFEAGVNYVDTAVMYGGGESQIVVGKALKGWRDKVNVSTKNHFYEKTDAEWWKNLEDSLHRLDVDCIDFYNHHGLNREKYTRDVEHRLSKLMFKAKEEGLIQHIGFSFHGGVDDLKFLVDLGYTEVVTLQYNMLDRSLEDGIAYAHENGMGVVVMGPVGGGRLGVQSDVLAELGPGVERIPELALRFVLSNPHVSAALSGMSAMEQVEENIATASDETPLDERGKKIVSEQLDRLQKMKETYCTGCKYCLPCEQEVNIPAVFDAWNLGHVYGLWDAAKSRYADIGVRPWAPGKRADACIECGECEDKCPQKIPIMSRLKEAHEALSDD